MPASYPPLSVVIISLNEEKRIGDCLASVRDLTDDLIVIDSHSRDATCEIAERGGARVFRRTWDGYSGQKNFGNAQARHDWILSLDADERVTPELAASIRAELARGPRADAYSIRFQNYFGPRCIRFGAWNPEWHVRLFDRRKLEWNCADVHEGLCGAGDARIARLRGCIRHLTVDTREQLAAKTERYSALFAEKLRRCGRTPAWPKIWLNPLWRFGRDYLIRLGLLDGQPGAWIAWEAARYTHLKYWKALPAPAPMRPGHWLAWGSAAALALLVLLRMPAPASFNGPSEASRAEAGYRAPIELIGAVVAALDDDDDNDDVRDVLPNDEDVLV